MQNELIKLIAAFFTAYYLVNVIVLKLKVRLKIQRRVKPFDCTVCLSVWIALGLMLLPAEISHWLFVLFGAGFLAQKIQ